MPAKKTADENATARIVHVTFPRTSNGVNRNELFKAALSSVRDEVPLRSDLAYELLSNKPKNDTERVAEVKIAWGPREAAPADSDPADGDFVGQQLDSLNVPQRMPAGLGGDDDK